MSDADRDIIERRPYGRYMVPITGLAVERYGSADAAFAHAVAVLNGSRAGVVLKKPHPDGGEG